MTIPKLGAVIKSLTAIKNKHADISNAGKYFHCLNCIRYLDINISCKVLSYSYYIMWVGMLGKFLIRCRYSYIIYYTHITCNTNSFITKFWCYMCLSLESNKEEISYRIPCHDGCRNLKII
jgi:hypothetical protein